MTVTLLPSAEVVYIAWLKQQADLLALHAGRVGTQLNATLPALRVTRIGDASRDTWRDNARLQTDCWAYDQLTAEQMSRTLVQVLPEVRTASFSGGKVHTYEITTGPYWAPDDPNLSSNARYIIDVRLLITK